MSILVLEASDPEPTVSALAPEAEASLQEGDGPRTSAAEDKAPLSLS